MPREPRDWPHAWGVFPQVIVMRNCRAWLWVGKPPSSLVLQQASIAQARSARVRHPPTEQPFFALATFLQPEKRRATAGNERSTRLPRRLIFI